MEASSYLTLGVAIYLASLCGWFVVALVYTKLGGGGSNRKLASKTMCDGVEVFGFDGDRSTEAMYKKIFIDNHYFSNGKLTLEGVESPLVVDVGAHIGLFSKFIAKNYPSAEIMSFEPIPTLSTAIRRNTASYSDRVCVEQVACGARNKSRTPFYYLPSDTASTSQSPPSERTPKGGASWLDFARCALVDGVSAKRYPRYPTMLLVTLFEIPVLCHVAFALLSPLMLFPIVWKFVTQKHETVSCRVQKLSDILGDYDEFAGRNIDLLKISVCECPYEVMEGVDEDMWEQVQQVVVDVREADKDFENVVQFLRSKDIDDIYVSRGTSEVGKLLGECTVFATRV